MIFIIGTSHSTQYRSDAVMRGEDCDVDPLTVHQFESYLRNAVAALHATVIAEELSAECVEQRQGGESVAVKVAEGLGIQHLYCDPDSRQRQAQGIAGSHKRMEFWISCIKQLSPDDRIIFVCGAEHSHEFAAKLQSRGLRAKVYCPDWTLEHGA